MLQALCGIFFQKQHFQDFRGWNILALKNVNLSYKYSPLNTHLDRNRTLIYSKAH
uniref:Uncharacterized protein n=1 Tax=Otolemur garnettii TaxID=30611 RepID=H0XTS8_OTOGA